MESEIFDKLAGSKGRIRVLHVLAKNGGLNIAQICRKAGMEYSHVVRDLEMLERLGLVRETRHDAERVFEAIFRFLVVRFENGRGVTVEITYP